MTITDKLQTLLMLHQLNTFYPYRAHQTNTMHDMLVKRINALHTDIINSYGDFQYEENHRTSEKRP